MRTRDKFVGAGLILAAFGVGFLCGGQDLLTRTAAARTYVAGEIPPELSFNVFTPNEFNGDPVRQIDDVARKVICYAIKASGNLSCVKY